MVGRAKHIMPTRVLSPEALFQADACIQGSEPKRDIKRPRGGGLGKATSLHCSVVTDGPRLANRCPSDTTLSSRNENTRTLFQSPECYNSFLISILTVSDVFPSEDIWEVCGDERAKPAWDVPASYKRYHIRL